MMLKTFLLGLVLGFVSKATSEPDLRLVDYLQTQIDRGGDTDILFKHFRSIFGKSYADKEEEHKRRTIFMDNLQYIQSHNVKYVKGLTSFSLTVNAFADLGHDEFLATYTSQKHQQRNSTRYRTSQKHRRSLGNTRDHRSSLNSSVPKSVDWRSQGYVTGVKNQKDCGACWAFSTTGTVEGQLYKKTRKLISLSEQQLVDCDKFNFGCEYGYPELAYEYIHGAKGLERETVYPYMAKLEICHYDRNKVVAGSAVSGFYYLPDHDESSLQQAVADIGPIAASIDANHKSFQFYHHGIYNESQCSQDSLTHGILVVGYGTYDGKDYWLVKNSYGKTWGEAGYIRMLRNKNNQCGIATEALYPVLG